MKKILLVVFILLILSLAAVYIFIPARINVSSASLASCIPKNIALSLSDLDKWRQWWPDQNIKTGDQFFYKGARYRLADRFTDGAEIELKVDKEEIASRIVIIPSGKDSSAVEWKISFEAGINPFRRIAQYSRASRLKNDTQEILSSLLNFASETKNIYGFHIERTTFTDTILAAIRFATGAYPSTGTIYRGIDQLKEKIKREGAEEKDFPMLNIMQTDSSHFETMIAICIDRLIKNEGNIFISRMVPMKDRFLKTEVTGGPSAIKSAHLAIANYMNDRFLSAPAIPFEILVTDRRNEPDTIKWKTTIFHPSM
jgi:hypothetical protein